jgi:uroporphyrinogen decarboxylase
LLDPAWIHDFCQVYTEFYKKHFDYMFEKVGLPDGIWLYEDLGYKNGLFASPKVMKNLIFPYYQELVAFFHEKGLPVILHSCSQAAPDLMPRQV